MCECAVQTLQPCGPFDGSDRGPRVALHRQARSAQCRYRDAGVIELMHAQQVRHGQRQRATTAVFEQCAARRVFNAPIPIAHRQDCLLGARHPLEHIEHFGALPSRDDRHPPLDDAGFFTCDCRQRVAEKSLVVHRDRGDRGHCGTNDVCRVQSPAQPHLDHGEIGLVAAEQHQPCRRQRLEHGDRAAGVDLLELSQGGRELTCRHEVSRDSKAFGHRNEVRRRHYVDAQSGRFADRADGGACAAFAVRSGDVDHRWEPLLRMAQVAQQRLQPFEAEVDQDGVERAQPPEDVVRSGDVVHPSIPRPYLQRASAGCSSCETRGLMVDGVRSSRPITRPSVAASSPRCTTMSTMPWSSRYSAF